MSAVCLRERVTKVQRHDARKGACQVMDAMRRFTKTSLKTMTLHRGIRAMGTFLLSVFRQIGRWFWI